MSDGPFPAPFRWARSDRCVFRKQAPHPYVRWPLRHLVTSHGPITVRKIANEVLTWARTEIGIGTTCFTSMESQWC
eukprot:10039254-Karenia_brevis.AAC.1